MSPKTESQKREAIAELAEKTGREIADAWLFPLDVGGVAGFWGVGPLLFVGDQPSRNEWPVCDRGRRLFYGKLAKYGCSDAHLTDFYKKRGESSGLRHWRRHGLPADWATIHKPILQREIEIVNPSRIIAVGSLAHDLIAHFLPELRPHLFTMLHFAVGIRPGRLHDFEFSLQVACGLCEEGERTSALALLARQGLAKTFAVRWIYGVGPTPPDYLNPQCQALIRTVASICSGSRPFVTGDALRQALNRGIYLRTCQYPWRIWTYYRSYLLERRCILAHCFSEI